MPKAVAQDGAGAFFEHDSARLHYLDSRGHGDSRGRGDSRDHGDDAKPALVFVHGWALDLRMWQPQADALSQTYRVIRMDRRGFGNSTGASSPEADARDLHALLDRLAIPQAILIGMSQGARAALSVAAFAPARVAGLVLDGAAAADGLLPEAPPDEVPVAALLRTLREHGIGALRRAVAAHPFMELHTRQRSTHALLSSMLSQYRGIDLAARVESAGQEIRLGSLQVPVQVINGAHDTPQRRLIGDAYCRILPRCERALVADAGHLPNLDNPSQYNAILTGFAERHWPTRMETSSWRT